MSTDLTPERLADWDADAEAHVTPHHVDSPHERVRVLIRALSDERDATERVRAAATELLRFDCVEDEDQIPRGIDVPDDYESGLHDAARRINAALDKAKGDS